MKRRIMLLTVVLVAGIPPVASGDRLGNLNSESTVFTPASDVVAPSVTTKDGFPVFEIRVPDGFVEVQVRASLTNFEPGFLLKDGADFVLNYIPTGAVVAGRKVYKALGTDHVATWNETTAALTFTGYTSIHGDAHTGSTTYQYFGLDGSGNRVWTATTSTNGDSGLTSRNRIYWSGGYWYVSRRSLLDYAMGNDSHPPGIWRAAAASPTTNPQGLTYTVVSDAVGNLSMAMHSWTFGYKSIYSTNTATAPWDIPGASLVGTPTGTFSLQKEFFVYRFCTTGIPSDAQWGTGSGDPDAWVYIANQSATTGVPGSEFKRQKWSAASSLQSQLQSGGTPGYTVLFQPSRGTLGATEWMQQNQDKLVWIYQVESPGGKPKHPNGADVWNSLYPHEWRKNRITLFVP